MKGHLDAQVELAVTVLTDSLVPRVKMGMLEPLVDAVGQVALDRMELLDQMASLEGEEGMGDLDLTENLVSV